MLALPTTLESLIKAADFLGKLGTAIIGEGYYLSFQQLPLVTRGLVLLDKWRLPSIKSNDIANFCKLFICRCLAMERKKGI